MIFAKLRNVFSPDGFFRYSPTHNWTGGAAGVSLVGPQFAPPYGGRINDAFPEFRSIRFAPAIDFQPDQVVVNGLPRFNQKQIAADHLSANGDPDLNGVLPYF